VNVIEHFNLMLGAKAPPIERAQVEVVLENFAQIGVGVLDAELVFLSALEEPVAADSKVGEGIV
jgi:hypothetical protein